MLPGLFTGLVWLTTGRRLQNYHTRTQTGRSAGIDYFQPEEVLEVNPVKLLTANGVATAVALDGVLTLGARKSE